MSYERAYKARDTAAMARYLEQIIESVPDSSVQRSAEQALNMINKGNLY